MHDVDQTSIYCWLFFLSTQCYHMHQRWENDWVQTQL